jgi:hypothetical protein
MRVVTISICVAFVRLVVGFTNATHMPILYSGIDIESLL